MRDLSVSLLAKLAIVLALPVSVAAQVGRASAAQAASTLSIAGQSGQAPLVQSNGKLYIDIETLARITQGSLRFQGNQAILTLPSSASSTPPEQANKPPQLSQAFLAAEIEALTQIREWRASLVNAVQNNGPVTQGWVGPLQRSADSKLQLAVAAASTVPDHEAVELLRNEFANMQQMSDQFLALHSKSSYTSTDSFADNPLDQKILSCERALVAMATNKQFQDEPSCH